VERETFVGIDVGTTKVVALIGEVGRDGGLTIIGKGIVPASGLSSTSSPAATPSTARKVS